jgi:hypothetical protein
MAHERESIGQALNYVLSVLDIVAGLALKPEDYDEVAAEQVRLGQIISRAQLILSFIDTRRPTPETVRRVN